MSLTESTCVAAGANVAVSVRAGFPTFQRRLLRGTFVPCATVCNAAAMRAIAFGRATLFYVTNPLRIADVAEDKGANGHVRIPVSVYHV